MNLKREYLLGLSCAIFAFLVIPPLQPASFTIENSNWDGLSKFKALIEENRSITVSETTIPLRLLGEIEADIIIIVGGNLPYFSEESNFLREFVEKGGDVIIQTYNPAHYSVQTAKNQDYEEFFEREIKYRQNLVYPPFCRIISWLSPNLAHNISS